MHSFERICFFETPRLLFCSATITTLISCAGGRHNMPPPLQLIFDLLILKVASVSRVMWATSVPILVFLGLFVLDLGRCTRQTDVSHASSLNASA